MRNILLSAGWKNILKVFLLLFLSKTVLLSAQEPPVLHIKIVNIRNQLGQLAVGLYCSDAEWPYEPCLSYIFEKSKVEDGILEVDLTDLSTGSYALSVLDDENCSGAMEYFCGIPREGWGFSNNPPVLRLRAPSYEQCVFELGQEPGSLEIRLSYLNAGMRR